MPAPRLDGLPNVIILAFYRKFLDHMESPTPLFVLALPEASQAHLFRDSLLRILLFSNPQSLRFDNHMFSGKEVHKLQYFKKSYSFSCGGRNS